MNVYFMVSPVLSRKENKDIPDTCQDLILSMTYTNTEITKEALFLSSKRVEV